MSEEEPLPPKEELKLAESQTKMVITITCPYCKYNWEVVDDNLDDCSKSDPVEIVEQCPENIFTVKNNNLEVVKDKIIDCTLCNACVELSNGKIKVEPNNAYEMIIEAWGQLEPKEIVSQAISAYDKQIDKFTELLGKIK